MRDLVGYGPNPPSFVWPKKAKIAINFIINYEEGAELSLINGDVEAEINGSDFPFSIKPRRQRNYSIESFMNTAAVSEYGVSLGFLISIRFLLLFSLQVMH